MFAINTNFADFNGEFVLSMNLKAHDLTNTYNKNMHTPKEK